MNQKIARNFVYPNVLVFYAIAKKSFDEMKVDELLRVRPKPNGRIPAGRQAGQF